MSIVKSTVMKNEHLYKTLAIGSKKLWLRLMLSLYSIVNSVRCEMLFNNVTFTIN